MRRVEPFSTICCLVRSANVRVTVSRDVPIFGERPAVRPCNSVEQSRCFRITPQANLPRSFTATWSGGGGIWCARVSYTDHHFRLASRDRMRCVALRAKPIAVIGKFSSARRPVTSRREQEQSALAQLSEQAIACGVCTLGYHRNLFSSSIARRATRNQRIPAFRFYERYDSRVFR